MEQHREHNKAQSRADRRPQVRIVSDLSTRNTMHIKFYLENVGKAFEAIRKLDEREWAESGKPQLSPNGKQVLTNATQVGLKLLRMQLFEMNFHLFDAYIEPWKKEGVVVTLVFCDEKKIEWGERFQLSSEVEEAVDGLIRSTWRYGHVFENPDQSVSIILIGRLKTETPERALAARALTLRLIELKKSKHPNVGTWKTQPTAQ